MKHDNNNINNNSYGTADIETVYRVDVDDSPSTTTSESTTSTKSKSKRVNWSSQLFQTNSFLQQKVNNNYYYYSDNHYLLFRKLIVYIQSIRTPVFCLRIVRNLQKSSFNNYNKQEDNNDDSDSISINNNNNDNNNINETSVYIISGLDLVFLPTNTTISSPSFVEAPIRIVGYRVPEYIWYMNSSFCGDVVQFILMVFIQSLFNITSSTMGWFIGSIASIPFRHTFHRYMVFGDYVGGYYNSLLRMYVIFSIVSVLSTIFHATISSIFTSFHYAILFIITINATGVCNYFLLKQVWKQPK